jgi:elongation factor P--beta-lysine ligase
MKIIPWSPTRDKNFESAASLKVKLYPLRIATVRAIFTFVIEPTIHKKLPTVLAFYPESKQALLPLLQ